jgi:RND family efflux transporter MFP subunit
MNIFSIIGSVIEDFINFFWPLTIRRKLIRFLVLLSVIALGLYLTATDNAPAPEVATSLPQVKVGTVATVLNTSATSFIGTLRSVSEAQIQSEVGGRVTSVPVKAGSVVRAGTIIATLENASERAGVLQAQGSYEVALAGVAQGDSGLRDAENGLSTAQNNAVTTYKSTYTSASGILFSTVDQFFANPNTTIPGVRIGGTDTSLLNNTRVRLQKSLKDYQNNTVTIVSSDNLTKALNEAEAIVRDIMLITDSMIVGLNRRSDNASVSEAENRAIISTFTAARTSLVGSLSAIDGARSGIISANEALTRAKISSTGNNVSSADAQVKIALGSLRSAQANLEKTILRSSISGTVDVLRVNTGDYIQAFTPVAQVSSVGGLEVSLFVGESDLALFTVGNNVSINGTATGTVVNIAPAIDPLTFKTEVKIAVTGDTNLTTGGTVTVSLESKNQTTDKRLLVPITAVKFNDTNGFMFTVVDGKLKSVPVELGQIVGSLITIVSGIDQTTEFVLDGRGRAEGQQVEVK